ncbi:BTB/POZ and MATH domain-containing protein 2-like [Miscanthus floridulus]|uniref:BTB/POZ and MATH domain-containing protein 2-like n=1 Tax=Miscanthus floridulus TaxID=154761 RepID=UPI00345A3FF6
MSPPPPPPPPEPSTVRATSPPVATPLPSASPAPSVAMSNDSRVWLLVVRRLPPTRRRRYRLLRPWPPLSGLNADLGRLLVTKEGADVEFEVLGRVFAAHKCVLAARSPVFKDKFFGLAKEEETIFVLIPDMRPEAFEALLQYVYTDMLPSEMSMNSSEAGAVLAEDLLAAADRYELKHLKLLTEKKMCMQSCRREHSLADVGAS